MPGRRSADWQLRAATTADREFLFQLHAQTMRPVIEATWGWDEAWQQADLDRRLRSYDVRVITQGGESIGTLCTEWLPGRLYIHELQILPGHQGRGIGSAILQGAIEQAAAQGLRLALAVVPANHRAQKLYEAIGFRVIGVEAPFIRMEHPAVRGQGQQP